MVFEACRHVDIPTKDILSWIFDQPAYDLDKPVLIDSANISRFVSANFARRTIRQLISGLRQAGLQPGDCVCVHSFNDIYYPLLVLSIIGAGGIFAGTNPAYTQYELTHHIKTAKVKYLIAEPELLGPVLSATQECQISRERIFIFHPLPEQRCPTGFKSWETLLQAGEQDWVRFDDLETARMTVAARFFSSGTTGLPKAALNTHIILHELVFGEQVAAQRDYEQVNIFPLPMFHAAIGPRIHSSVLKVGQRTYIMRRFDLEQYFICIEKFGVTELFHVPPMTIAVVMSPLAKKYSLKSIRYAWGGAAPLSKELQSRLVALLGPGAGFAQVYGMTETTCICTMYQWPEHDDTGGVGRPIANTDIKLIDDAGNDITGYGVRGEICVRGPTVILGYFENPEANRTTFDADGFLHSGDIGYCDATSKKWYIVDRKKELIKVRAFQVAPAELEGVLLSHPNIIDAAVIGIPGHDAGSELPRAYVVRRPGSDAAAATAQLTEKAVQDFVRPKLASFKHLDGGVAFVDAIPKNASGKILKRILREQARLELGLGTANKL